MKIGAAIVLCAAASSTIWAQAATFEAAVVKPSQSIDFRAFPSMRNGTFTAQAASLKTLIYVAYSTHDLLISGPGWIDTEGYDISAKAPEGVPDSEVGSLLQSLLTGRFRLKVHFEMKEMPAYALVVAKGGTKLKPYDPAQRPEIPRNAGQSVLTGVGTTSQIAEMLFRGAGRPVVDKTGMNEQGLFAWAVSYTPLSADGNPAATAPDFFTAVEEQLGLKLEPTRETLRILVVDSAERVPSEN